MSTPLYRYTDQDGIVHLVERPTDAPKKYRKNLTKVSQSIDVEAALSKTKKLALELQTKANELKSLQTQVVKDAPTGAGPLEGLHAPSLGLGAGAGFIVALVAGKLFGRSNMLLKMLAIGTTMAVASTMYLGYVQRKAQLSNNAVATPQDIIEQARKAVQQAQTRVNEQEKILETIRQ